MNPLRRIKQVLALTIGVFAVAAAYISYTIVERQEYLRDVSRYNVVWASSQALAELQRLQYLATDFALPGSTVSKQDVQLAFDILFNRLNILRGGELAVFTAENPEQKATVDDFAAALAELEPVVAAIGEPGAARRVAARLDPLEHKFVRFAATANQYGGALVAKDQHALLQLHGIFSGLAAGLVLCGLVFIALLFSQNRVIQRAHDELRLLNADLHAAKQLAEAASEAKSRFLATMSHELRTPLNAITGFSEMMTTEAFGPLGHPKYVDYARDIQVSGAHMFELINDILTMARLDAGHYELEIENVTVGTAIEATLAMFRGTAMSKEREIVVAPGDDRAVLKVDERAFRQMLLNLLSNAVKFSPPGTPVRISSGRNAAGEFEITVCDQGIGMTDAEARAAVLPFHQIDNRISRKYSGTGLGLSIVKTLMERHGGRLAIRSVPNAGSDIALVFPPERVVSSRLAQVA